MAESGGISSAAPTVLNPCVLVQEAVKAMLRCLGLETAQDPPASTPLKPQDSSPPSTAQASDPPSSTAAELDPPSKTPDPVEADDPSTTLEEDNQAILATSALTKPPINTGTGPQTN